MSYSKYLQFQAKLYPVLPFLILQASKVRKSRPMPTPISENLIFGNGDRKILILGESTVAGVGASTPEFTLAGHLFRLLGKDFQIENYGKNGLLSAQVLFHLEEKIKTTSGKTEGVLLFLGANDCFRLTHPKQYRKDLEKLVAYLESTIYPDWIYLADIPPVQIFPAFPKVFRYYLDRQRAFLQKEMTSLAINHPNVIFHPIEIEMNPEFFATDGIHPSDIGYGRIADFAKEGLLKSGHLKLN